MDKIFGNDLFDLSLEPVTEKDKDRLAKIMAYGSDETKWPTAKKYSQENESEVQYEELDRFDER